MQNTWDTVVKIASAVAGAIVGALAEAVMSWSSAMTALLVFMVIDYISGLIVAGMGKSTKTESGGLSSKIGYDGLKRKFMALLMVIVAIMIDFLMGDKHIFRDAACWFYLANEGLSILENMALAGVPFPEKIRQVLEQAKEQEKPPDVGA